MPLGRPGQEALGIGEPKKNQIDPGPRAETGAEMVSESDPGMVVEISGHRGAAKSRLKLKIAASTVGV